MTRRTTRVVIALFVVGATLGALVAVGVWTAPERDSVRAYTALIAAANRSDAESARPLCTRRYLATHPLKRASEGGLVGLPRGIHKNFQVWRSGADVLLCPTNRVGPVYKFVREAGSWRFDGPIGILRGRGEFLPIDESNEEFDLVAPG